MGLLAGDDLDVSLIFENGRPSRSISSTGLSETLVQCPVGHSGLQEGQRIAAAGRRVVQKGSCQGQGSGFFLLVTLPKYRLLGVSFACAVLQDQDHRSSSSCRQWQFSEHLSALDGDKGKGAGHEDEKPMSEPCSSLTTSKGFNS
jgi:hypothetical protein